MAFFFFNSELDRRRRRSTRARPARPSPLLPLEAWDELVAANPVLADALQPDVEALLIVRPARADAFDCYLVPIDACYELVGIVRRHWKGFDGGEEAWRDIEAFFDDAARAQPPA